MPEETLNLIVALSYPFFPKVFPLSAKNVVLNLSNTATTYAESKFYLEIKNARCLEGRNIRYRAVKA